MPKYTYTNLERKIRQHYRLARRLTDAEVQAEVANLHRKHAKGTLDDSQRRLYAALDLCPPGDCPLNTTNTLGVEP